MKKYDYWSHVAAQGGRENVEANPDLIAETEEQDSVDLESFKKILEEEIKKLEPKEREILLLCGAKGLDTMVVAKQLGMVQSTVWRIFERVKKKILHKYPKSGV